MSIIGDEYRDRYAAVHATWPSSLPPLTAQEAERAIRRLHRAYLKRRLIDPVQITSGRRYTWKRNGVMYVNPNNGWRELVHDFSHYVFSRKHPDASGHDPRHVNVEQSMARYVVEHGWLDGKLKPKPKAIKAVDPLSAIDDKIKRWNSKLRRAENALKKLQRKRKLLLKKMEAQ